MAKPVAPLGTLAQRFVSLSVAAATPVRSDSLVKWMAEGQARTDCLRNRAQPVSDDEEYFHAALAHVGFLPSLLARVEEGGAVDRSLEHSAGLAGLIAASLAPEENGRVYFMPDFGRLNAVVRKVAVGLHHRRYRRFFRPSAFTPLGVFHIQRLPPC